MRWTLGLAWFAMGCNQLIGVHEYSTDAATDACPGCQCTIDSDCTDLHSVCDQSQCTCSAGYALGDTGCVWVGVIDDPGFERSPDRWTATTGATTLTPSAPQASGMQDPGYIVFPQDATCHFGTVTQSIKMPRFSRSESLVVSTTYSADNTIIFYVGSYPEIGLASSWYETSYPLAGTAYTTANRMCLGAGQYAPESSTGVGTGMALNVSARDMPGLSNCGLRTPNETFRFDHIEILPAAPGECPLPGQVMNGDVEGGSTGWTLGGTAAVETCATGHCVALHETRLCEPSTAKTLLSVPVASGNAAAALSLDHTNMTIPLGDLTMALDSIQSMQVGTSATTDSYCLPAYMRGGVYPLATSVQPSTGKCLDGTIYLDNVTVTNAVACGGSDYLADPSFESGFRPIGAYNLGGSVGNELDPAGAFPGGTHELHIATYTCGASATWRALPTVPPMFGRPALKFHYRWTGKNIATFATSPGTLGAIGGSTTWTEAEICLDPKLAGRMQIVQFTLSQPVPTTCPNATESVYIDEMSLIDEPNCNPAP